MRPISLTDHEMKVLIDIARTIPWQSRGEFCRRFADQVAALKDPGPADLWRAAHAARRETMTPSSRPMPKIDRPDAGEAATAGLPPA
jgi:hypothetical protein